MTAADIRSEMRIGKEYDGAWFSMAQCTYCTRTDGLVVVREPGSRNKTLGRLVTRCPDHRRKS